MGARGCLLGIAAWLAACAPGAASQPDAAQSPERPQHIPYCPEETPLTQLRCSDSLSGTIASSDSATLGGTCADGRCYSCGTPFAALEQTGVEDVYEFWCQRTGTVTVRLSAMTCDVDAYVLDVGCNPYDHCLAGDTGFGTSDRTLTFDCFTALYPFYIVIEQGWCAEGSYTVSVDLDGATCLEDCVDGIDNDGDGKIDCGDFDCARHPGCPCDVDGDGSFAEDCGGDDCDDENDRVFPGLWDGCDGIDNDCDGLLDESPAVPCVPDAGPADAALPDAMPGAPDATTPDAAVHDAAVDVPDATAPDAAVPDAAVAVPDAAAPDAAVAVPDAAVPDAAVWDAATDVPDAATDAPDAGVPDAAVDLPDAAAADAGLADATVAPADAALADGDSAGCACRVRNGRRTAPPGGSALLFAVAVVVVSARRRRSAGSRDARERGGANRRCG